MFLNGISLSFCKKPRNVHFDLNSVFSLSCKINFADLWSLFMERITINHFVIEKRMSDDSCGSVDIAAALIIVAAGQRTQLKLRRKRMWWSLSVYRNRKE